MKLKYLIFLYIFIFISNSFAQSRSDNISLIGYFPMEWRSYWDIKKYMNCIFLTTNLGMDIIDINNPTMPLKIGEYKVNYYRAYEIDFIGNYAFLACDGFGLRVFDIHDLNSIAELKEVSVVDKPQSIFISGKYMYVTNSGLYILDITDIEKPCVDSYVKIINGSINNVVVQGNHAYINATSHLFGGIKVIDVSDPYYPIEIGECNTYGQPFDIQISDNYAYVANGLSTIGLGGQVKIIDVKDPQNPIEIANIKLRNFVRSIAVSGNFLYVAADGDTIRIFDIIDPINPNQIGYIYIDGYTSILTTYEDYIYIANNEKGIFIARNKSYTPVTRETFSLIKFFLNQNYPNPFNSSTEIKYSLPQAKSTYHVILKIYDIKGRLVNTLVNQNQGAGTYALSWDGRDINEHLVSSGIYFYTLRADKFKTTNKMLLIR